MIVAGIVFIVAVIFFTGAMVGGHDRPFHHHHGMVGPDGGPIILPGPFPPGMGPGWPGGPPMIPGPFGPGPAGPGGPGNPPPAPPKP